MAEKKKVTDYLHFSGWSAKVFLKNLPFIVFLGLLCTVYIANSHYALRKIREIKIKQENLKQLRWHYMTIQTDLMYSNKHSEVVRNVEEIDLKIQTKKPKKIVVTKSKASNDKRKK